MAERDEIEIVDSSLPVRLARPRSVNMIQIMVNDLDALDAANADEARALGFFTTLLGAAVGAALGWVAGWDQFGEVRHALFFSATLVTAVLAVWFGLVWRQRVRARKALTQRLRAGQHATT